MSKTLPEEFIQLVQKSLPNEENFTKFIEYCQRPLRKSIRVNTLKISVSDFVRRMSAKGWELTSIPWCPEGFWLQRDDETLPLGNTLEHIGGLFYIQEASSMLPVTALFTHLKENSDLLILDAAAAPGSKTTQIAAHLQQQGAIVANEFSASRIKGLFSNLQRCGIANVALTNYNADVFGKWLPETFDGILLDAPCSGEGTLRKDPQALDNWSLKHVQEIATLQGTLLNSALRALKPGGILIYSTCTLNNFENQQAVLNICNHFHQSLEVLNLKTLFPSADKALTKEGYLHIWPHLYDCEGFFVAALRKKTEIPIEPCVKKVKPLPFYPATKKQADSVLQHLRKQFGLELEPSYGKLMTRENEFWLFPQKIISMTDEIRFDRIGLKLAVQFRKEFRLTHEAASRFAPQMTQNILELPIDQAEAFIQGKDIKYDQGEQKNGEVILVCQQVTLGIGKWLKGKIKNRLPRELVRDVIEFK
ncbi:MAG: Ribosomal RNA small subunit methyltransferase F [Candidatus Celerinatantimonas neptuna]|nr:MAG: Ribosomal RNA small subunit methyltransferase F [Candidatus Celerinatantimonas neptuna]